MIKFRLVDLLYLRNLLGTNLFILQTPGENSDSGFV